MKKYEVMYIVRADLDADTIKKEISDINAIFTANDSKILERKEWGMRELAYEINRARKGFYVWTSIEATSKAISEFDRIVGYNEHIIRHIVICEAE